MEWDKDEELLQLMLAGNFNTLLTFDKNVQHQQNFVKFPIAVFVLTASNNIYDQLTHLSPLINQIPGGEMLQPGLLLSRLTTVAHKMLYSLTKKP